MRCVIYTRKSADETDPQLSSLQVQRDLCAAYIASQAYEGWHLLPEQYDDGGYSGATLKRPALQALLTRYGRVRWTWSFSTRSTACRVRFATFSISSPFSSPMTSRSCRSRNR
ncbi:hypothetical protein GO497_15325 [Acidovorax citrulli]|nr:hypothetical protein [Paracidovorax citrulli]